MLEVNCMCPSLLLKQHNSIRMPVDFASYLVAASPPGVGFFTGPTQLYQGFNKTVMTGNSVLSKADHLQHVNPNSSNTADLAQSFLDYCRVRDRVETESDEGSTEGSTGDRTPLSRPATPPTDCSSIPTSPRGSAKKRVIFADDLGFALENVRIMTESSDTPPRLGDLFKSVTHGAQPGAIVTPPLQLNFTQPASDYLEFRRRIETDCVCLENVILKDYNVLGTIKVKNLSFEKTVFVRCSFDNWDTINEYQATYVSNSVTSSMFDTFSFNIGVPTSMKTMHFCINYKTNNYDFWDSNKGVNYEIVIADLSQSTSCYREDAAIFGLGSDQDWSVYSSWSNRDTSLPYY